MGTMLQDSDVPRRALILLLAVIPLVMFVSAESVGLLGTVSLLEIPEARRELAAEAELVRAELAELPDFSETRQIDAYGFHGAYLPVLDEIPESPRWTVTLSWGAIAKLEQVILVPAIDPRSGKVQGYGFPRRFRVSKLLPDGTSEVVVEWIDEDCPDPSHVPLRINISEPRGAAVRIDVYRGKKEGSMEFFALGEVFGVVEKEIWKANTVQARPAFESSPYWSKNYLADQKTGLGMPLGLAPANQETEARRDFSVKFERSFKDNCLIDFDLGSQKKMGWLTLIPAKPPSGSIVPGYGFPRKIKLFGGREVGNKAVFRPIKSGSYQGAVGDNAVRIPLYAFEGRWLRLDISDLAKHNGRKIFALGEASISMRETQYPVEGVRLRGFPEGAESRTGALTDGFAGGRPKLPMMEWFELIERQHGLTQRLDEIILADTAMEVRWAKAVKKLIIVAVILFLLALVALGIHRQLSLQQLRSRITEERHHTEIEQMKLRFFTHISHELRTPLTVIPAPIERAMKQVGEGKLRTYLGVALKNVHELQQLVDQILDMRQIQDGKMKIVPLEMELVVHVQSIIDSIRPLAEDKGIGLVFDPAVESYVVRMDPEALKRVLGNLMGNAIKFTPSGGRIVVRLSVARRAIVFSVEDNGPGIAADDLSNIFEQHYRGHSSSVVQTQGSGMGLALVHEVVTLLGGKVKVQSPVGDGRGSRFTVKIPIKKGMNDE